MAPPNDIKRGRGRPRKQRDTVEEGKFVCLLVFSLYYQCNIEFEFNA